MKNLRLLLITALLTVTAAVSLDNSTGGAGSFGGGGDLLTDKPIEFAKFQQVIGESRFAMPFVFQYLEMNSNLHGVDQETYFLLFPQKKEHGIYPLLKKVEYQILEDHSCIAPDGVLRDASARFIDNTPTVCLSFFSMSGKLTEKQAWQQIPAVIVHELSHLIGVEETVAKALEARVRDQIHHKSIESIDDLFDQQIESLEAFLESIKYAIYAIDNFEEEAPETALRSTFVMLNWFDDIMPKPEMTGLNFFDRRSNLGTTSLYLQLESLNYFWDDEDQQRQEYDERFKGESSMSMKRYAIGKEWMCQPHCEQLSGRIHHIAEGDWQSAKRQLRGLSRTLRSMLDNLRSFQ